MVCWFSYFDHGANLMLAVPPDFGPPPYQRKPLQFRLWQLMLLVTLCAVLAGMLRLVPLPMLETLGDGVIGVVVWSFFLCLLAAPAYLLTYRFTKSRGWAFLCGVASLALFFALAPTLEQPPTAVRRSHCGYNLKAIGIALHTYHDDYQSLPPAYVCDENGKPMHSWRVLLLPYLEQQSLYKKYDFSEPWDGPSNILLAPEITAVYQCPEETHQGVSGVSYVAVVGKGTMWPGEKSITFQDVKDGRSNTIMVVEATNSGILGSEPRDLDYSKLALQINPPLGGGISSLHGKSWRTEANGVQVVFGDGAVHFLRTDLKPATLKLLLEINDGQPIGDY